MFAIYQLLRRLKMTRARILLFALAVSGVLVLSTSSVYAANTITLQTTVRDFTPLTNADFENHYNWGLTPGLVSPILPPDKRPVFVGTPGGPGAIHSADTFAQWYRDVPGVNINIPRELILTETALGSGVYAYSNSAFFPINGLGFGNYLWGLNYHFTMDFHAKFTYENGQTFNFQGDDDVWVYIDNKLVIDLGGIHGPAASSVNLDTLGLTEGNTYDFDFYFAERHTTGSNLRINTGIELQPVNNLAPNVGPITVPTDPQVVSASTDVGANFTDPDILDTHTAVWDWGDGSTSPGTVSEANGSGSAAGSHVYSQAGVYTVKLTVTDNDGATGESTASQFVVVYDPNAGFVTGGGWVNSPSGAYVSDPNLTGKANFGFVSKYQKGATVPTGQTEFQFKVANLNFHSSSYDWLVIAGARAQYKGSGTINGVGDYGFMLTAIDGQLNNTGGDRFRIKIWDKVTDAIVYDNQLGTSDTSDETTELGGGSIVIHK